jgi:uncharacterized membrane protein YeiH
VASVESFSPIVELTRPYVEFTAVAAGAVSGALHARSRRFDFVGIVIIGLVSGLGGGLIRDALLGVGPALALAQEQLLNTALASALVGGLFGTMFRPLAKPIWVIDTLALGVFAVAGLQRANSAGLAIVPSIFLGVVTCVGGGLVRDVLCRETPKLLLPGQPYTPIALVAGVVYMAAIRYFVLTPFVAEMLAVSSAFLLRLVIVWRGWILPSPHDIVKTGVS